MSKSLSNDSYSPGAIRDETAGTRGELRHLALDAIHHVNSQFLEFVCSQAALTNAPFPFGKSLRMRFANLASAERERLSRCGTLLVELGLSDPHRWRTADNEVETSNSLIARSNHWMLAQEAFIIAHATALVVWSVLHLSRAESGVLLGISPETAKVIGEMGVTELSHLAQRHTDWVHLKWTHLPDVWSRLLDFSTASEPERGNFTALRCLQLALGKSVHLERYMAKRRRQI